MRRMGLEDLVTNIGKNSSRSRRYTPTNYPLATKTMKNEGFRPLNTWVITLKMKVLGSHGNMALENPSLQSEMHLPMVDFPNCHVSFEEGQLSII